MKEITTLGQTEIANSRMSPWYIAATTAATQGPHSRYISRAHLYIDSLLQTPNLHPQPTSVHSHLASTGRGTGIMLGAADAASNPGNSAVKRASINKKKNSFSPLPAVIPKIPYVNPRVH